MSLLLPHVASARSQAGYRKSLRAQLYVTQPVSDLMKCWRRQWTTGFLLLRASTAYARHLQRPAHERRTKLARLPAPQGSCKRMSSAPWSLVRCHDSSFLKQCLLPVAPTAGVGYVSWPLPTVCACPSAATRDTPPMMFPIKVGKTKPASACPQERTPDQAR